MPHNPEFLKTNKVSTKSKIPREPLRDKEETAKIFGYKSGETLLSAMHKGLFPKPDTYIIKMDGVNKKAFWKTSTIKKELDRRKKIMKGELQWRQLQ